MVLAEQLREDGKEVSSEEPRDVGSHELLQARAAPDRGQRREPLELRHDHEALLSHLLLPTPYRQARARRRRRRKRPPSEAAAREETEEHWVVGPRTRTVNE